MKLLRQISANVLAACFIIDLPDLGGAASARDGCAGANADDVRRALPRLARFWARWLMEGSDGLGAEHRSPMRRRSFNSASLM